ncbi:hypothetical protein SLS62_004989 [Diatrype stigma]|uniref:FAD/NAD(P)-binding domain-containing protein n=1 Tax=Diatrype stigma TaxID=117547 RepID=A0AAN9UVM6_9PEZI
MSKPILAIIGSGWGGFTLAQKVSLAKYSIVVISPIRTIQYTPLLASAACGLFNFRLAEEPVRRKRRHEVQYYKATAETIDFDKRVIRCKAAAWIEGEGGGGSGEKPHESSNTFEVKYDKVCIAPGCDIQDFGTPGAREHALFLRTTNDARLIQQRVLEMVDAASLPGVSASRQREILSIRIVGGGAVGIEAAAELWDLWFEELRFLCPHLDSDGDGNKLTITIHDVAPQILSTFDSSLSEYAAQSLRGKHVELKTSSHIERVEAGAIVTREDGRLPAGLLIWATGNKASSLVETLRSVKKPEEGLPRILTDRYLRVLRADGRGPIEGAYALGDAADVEGESLPALAEVAMQKSEYLTGVLNAADDEAALVRPFAYKQRALLAYLGRRDGVIGGRQDWTGVSAWVAWRSGSLAWTRSWRRRFMIMISWLFVWFGGRDIARP